MGLLDGKVCIVTGAGRGIGRDHALALAGRGAKVVVNDPGVAVDGRGGDTAPAQQVVDEIKAAGGEAVANFASVTDWKQAEGLVQQAYDQWGRLDVLINNAGILRDRIIWNMTEDDWDAVMGVHMKGTYCCTHHAVVRWRGQFKQTNQPVNGRIINTVSAAMFGAVGQSNYGAAKAGIMGFTLGVALEVAPMGITCNAIRPGGQTRMSASIPSTGALGAAAARAQSGQAEPKAKAEEAPRTFGSELAVYLASDAAGWISGQLLMTRDDRLELDKGWRPERVLMNRGGKPWTAEDLVAGMPRLVGAGPTGLIEFLGF
jgi:NAD(P)-dependent dehydrogenase (short-subunit alcohol dehydrogenase family)